MVEIEEGHYYMAVMASMGLRKAPVKILKNYKNYSLAKTLPHAASLRDAEGFTVCVDSTCLIEEMTKEEVENYMSTYNPSLPVKGDADFAEAKYKY